jgi:hypothetical protein
MRSGNWRLALAALALATAAIPGAVAQCGLSGKALKPTGWKQQTGDAYLVRALLAEANDDYDAFSIVLPGRETTPRVNHRMALSSSRRSP